MSKLRASNMIGAVGYPAPIPRFTLDNYYGGHLGLQEVGGVIELRVVIWGDSLGTLTPGAIHDPIETMAAALEQAIIRDNRQTKLKVTIINRSWGGRNTRNAGDDGQTVQSIIDGGAAPPEWPDIGSLDLNQPWADIIEADAPHMIFYAFGMNDGHNFSGLFVEAMRLRVAAMPSKPLLIVSTPLRPSHLAANVNIGSFVAQQGRIMGATGQRTWAEYSNVPFLDCARHECMITAGADGYGFDPCTVYFREDDGVSAPMVFRRRDSAKTDSDWQAEITLADAASLNAHTLRFYTSPAPGPDASDPTGPVFPELGQTWIDLYAVGGFYAIRPYFGLNLSEAVSDVATVTGPVTVKFALKNGWLRATVGGKVVYNNVVPYSGARMKPRIAFADGHAPTGATIKYIRGQWQRTLAVLDDRQAFGSTAISGDIEGGNDLNHPTSWLNALVWSAVIEAVDWFMPILSEVMSASPGTNGRRVGINTKDPQGTLHIVKTALASVPALNPIANALVLEGAGLSIINEDDGTCRITLGSPTHGMEGEIIYAPATGYMTIRTNRPDPTRPLDTAAAGHSALQLSVNDGPPTWRTVKAGANGTGPGGTGRALYIDNA